jgi:hypothetical protein
LRDLQQRIQRCILVTGQAAPCVEEAVHGDAGAVQARDDLGGRRVCGVVRAGQIGGQRVPAIGDIPGRGLVSRRPAGADHPLQRLVGPAGHVERELFERMRHRAGQDRHCRSPDREAPADEEGAEEGEGAEDDQGEEEGEDAEADQDEEEGEDAEGDQDEEEGEDAERGASSTSTLSRTVRAVASPRLSM